jgi:small conductance mechanosensitive channel
LISNKPLNALLASVLLACLPLLGLAQEEGDSYQARTTADPAIAVEELELLLKPLTRSQLLVEADAWQALLQGIAEEVADKEVEIKRQNTEIKAAKAAQALAEDAREELEEQQAAAADSASSDDGAEAAEAAEAVAEDARQLINDAQQSAPDAGSEVEVAEALLDESLSADQKSRKLEDAAEAVAKEAEATEGEKLSLLEQLTALREERTGIVDRLRAVLDEIERKTDESDADTLARVTDLRLYSRAVSGIVVDVEDTTSAWIAIKGWLLSDQGGKRWGLNLARFFAILFIAWIVARLVSFIIKQALRRVPGTSVLLESFLVKSTRWVVMAVGFIMALSALEVSIGPLLAVVGAAGFIIAFALQDSLSNFASGLMILFFRPFDQGDVVDAGGVSGKVVSMNLVSTTLMTFDNKRMVVPNNMIWSDVITNATGVSERRIDMEFGIGYSDDIDSAQAILTDIITSHPKVLEQPEPTIRMHALADSSVNFIVRPWSRPEDYWDVYWDVTRAVKQRFDEAGIGIPFPQRDVHLYIESDQGAAAPSLATARSRPERGIGGTQSKDGGLDDPDQDDDDS